MSKRKSAGLAQPIPITLDRERVIDFNLDACRRLGEALDINTLDGSLFRKTWDATTFQTVLWAGLVTDDPALTLGAAGRLVSRNRMNEVFEAVLRAWGIDPKAALLSAKDLADAIEKASAEEVTVEPDPPCLTG